MFASSKRQREEKDVVLPCPKKNKECEETIGVDYVVSIVDALRLNNDGSWTVWWQGWKTPTQEPLKNVQDIDLLFLLKCKARLGKRVKFTGSRNNAVKSHLNVGVATTMYQGKGVLCALNAISNALGVKMSISLYNLIEEKYGQFPTLKELACFFNTTKNVPCKM
jgi:hypothetical protein